MACASPIASPIAFPIAPHPLKAENSTHRLAERKSLEFILQVSLANLHFVIHQMSLVEVDDRMEVWKSEALCGAASAAAEMAWLSRWEMGRDWGIREGAGSVRRRLGGGWDVDKRGDAVGDVISRLGKSVLDALLRGSGEDVRRRVGGGKTEASDPFGDGYPKDKKVVIPQMWTINDLYEREKMSRSFLLPQAHMNASLAIRQEIQRFESVHPSIYAIYDLIEMIPDPLLSQQIREHVVSIEDSFVNSQEWTVSRGVPDLRLGIVGSLSSGKSALVHRYLTGSYMQEESPEGGRFKKEVVLDGQSYLLLIRDEGGPPEFQFTAWVDAVIFVFSLENEASFNAIYNYYSKMSNFRHPSEIPIILVGTQDAISENNPRVIDDSRARRLAADLKKCAYYETCATYGLNVEKVFQDACQRIANQRLGYQSRPSTPNQTGRPFQFLGSPSLGNSPSLHNVNSLPPAVSGLAISQTSSSSASYPRDSPPTTTGRFASAEVPGGACSLDPGKPPSGRGNEERSFPTGDSSPKDQLPTPSSTPTTARKSRRRSNLFASSKKEDAEKKCKNGELGIGRAIPLKQGHLYKRSTKGLNKEWKKKYVTLCDDGRLTYHPSLHDYMEDIHGKEISLRYTTVKVPGQRPRGISNGVIDFGGLSILDRSSGKKEPHLGSTNSKVALTSFELIRDGPGAIRSASLVNCDNVLQGNADTSKNETSNVKKKHRRMKSSLNRKADDGDDSDGYEFLLVSCDNKTWQFEAANSEERDEWVSAIEQCILNCLQLNETGKAKGRPPADPSAILSLRRVVEGNLACCDCDAPNPDWASLNLGTLICIECSGIHRNLGSHISRVRSLDLDEWPPGHLSVMMALGNRIANSIWESNVQGRNKPSPNSSRDEKERWIRAKYEEKLFLAPLSTPHVPLGQQILDAVCRGDVRHVALLLSHAEPEHASTCVSPRDPRTPLHIACAMGNLPITQLLLWHGANPSAVDQDGPTCLSYARSSGSSEIVDLVLQYLSGGTTKSIGTGMGTFPLRRGSLTKEKCTNPSPASYEKLPSSFI
ncbi:unnamed protein product [Darwinula stevensoni]|uniref:Uncharacterized protein n=1 Tax=Darwinula stevensoni TaxID=69355 RepID=A0A7R9AEX1_9CRUS|nr:unnamed protein product [Darwinula stevensoni]CAG0902052.1 unnamed protein product [Darwinula stevensoni]